MQVLTLHPQAFEQHAARLAKLVERGTPTQYDAIVAVKRGGSYVCDAFCHYYPKENYGARYDIALQRPSTKRKNGIVSTLLRRLPYPILDIMRIAESAFLSMRRKGEKDANFPSVDIPEELTETLRDNEIPKILIIDDAIDSGDTLFAIAETLKKANGNVIVRIAVMTETTKQPRIRADYSLYRNKTLIRFPWSNDYKLR